MSLSRLPSWRWLLLAVPLLLAAWTAFDMAAAHSATPFWDEWASVQWWERLSRGERVVDWLLAQHNEHRIFFPRLVFLADLKWGQGRDVINLCAIAVIQLIGAAFYLVVAQPRRLTGLGWLGVAIAASLMVVLTQWENFVWGFQVQFVGVFVVVAWSLYLFLRATEARERIGWGWMAGALALQVVAAFSMANGLFGGVVMALMALVTRRGWRAVLIPVATTAALAAVYLHGFHATSDKPALPVVLHDPVGYLRYVLAFLGNAWGRGHVGRAQLFGLVGIAATLAMAWLVIAGRERDRRFDVLLAVVLFVGLSGAMTAVGRLELGVPQALSSRYVTPTCHFWAAHAVFWAIRAERAARRAIRVAAAAGLALVYLALVPQQMIGERDLFVINYERVRMGTSALLSGVADQQALGGVYPDLAELARLSRFLEQKRLALYADDPGYRAGWTFRPTTAPAPAGRCDGAFDAVQPVDQAGVGKAVGWGWDRTGHAPFREILLVDGGNRILGLGVSGMFRPDVRHAEHRLDAETAGWVASLNATGGDVSAYGLTRDGRTCFLGTRPWPK